MNYQELFANLTTPLVSDACIRLGVPLRLAPSGIKSVVSGHKVVGPALPVTHFGSVDIFIERMHESVTGQVLVIDNQGRSDEGCIGDLIALEAKVNGLAGIVLWGNHRDTEELTEIGLPVFTYGTYPSGPTRLDARESDTVNFGPFRVNDDDFVFADADGVLFGPRKKSLELAEMAAEIRETERRHASLIDTGETLYRQLKFDEFLRLRAKDPGLTFRSFLNSIGGAIEV